MTGASATEAFRPIRVIAMLLIIAALHLGREVLIPAALAVLLTFLLYPIVYRLRRWGLNRVAAVTVTICLAGLVTAGVGFLVAQQFIDLGVKLPDYRDNLRQKAREIRGSGGTTLSRLSGTIEDLKEELAATQPATQPAVGGVPVIPRPAPVRVEMVDNGVDVGNLASTFAAPLLVPIAGAAITSLLVIFLLLHSDDIRERLITFAGMRQISLTTAAMDEASTRIGRYLRMQAVVNVCYGVMVAIGLAIFGVPNALLWGVLATLLRFIPYIGPWIAAVLPTLLAFAVFPGWARPIGVIVMFIVVEFVTNMILEPWLYGSSVGISSLGVVVATVFWAWVWGPVGMILAVPITACLVVMGKHVPQLALLHQLFGTDATVPTVGRLYQRLLVGDETSADEIIKAEVKSSSLAEACDSLLLPVLSELKRDSGVGLIDGEQMTRALNILDLVCETDSSPPPGGPKLLCVAGQNEVDACAAGLLACAANCGGLAAEAISSHALASEAAQRAEDADVAWVAVVQVPPISTVHTRRLLKVLLTKLGDARRLMELSFNSVHPQTGSETVSDANQGSRTIRREHSFTPLLAWLKELAAVKNEPPSTRPAVAEAAAV